MRVIELREKQLEIALIRSAICGDLLSDEQKLLYNAEILLQIAKIAKKHDVLHLLVLGLKKNELLDKNIKQFEMELFKTVYRYERLNYELKQVCKALEEAQIPFVPLKGSVIKMYYPEPWMRTSCDIDVLVHREDLENTISYLVSNHNYVEKERATHDVSLFTQTGIHVELHFDLVEEGRAKNAIDVLQAVWENATLHENSEYWYEMTDAYFYFYHIAHMSKHFENGGCGCVSSDHEV